MTERRAFIVLAIAMVPLTFGAVDGLAALGANPDLIGLAEVLILCIAGFGVGGIVTHYR